MQETFDFVIFGGGGDLALRKLIPAMYRAHRAGELPEGARIIPTSRKREAVAEYPEKVRKAVAEYLKDEYNDEDWAKFAQCLVPAAVDISTLDDRWDDFAALLNESGDSSRVYYLSTPPAVYGVCCQHLSEKNMITDRSRVVLEKPIGYDGKSADEINEQVAQYFPEDGIYRIDHYMGKETVQNLMALRFSNGIFEQMWDAKSIDHVQISISETVGLEGRVGFYDGAGAMRDMVQNHIMQLLCLVAMDSPHTLDAKSIRTEKLKVVESLRPITGDDVALHTVRGQYAGGEMSGKSVDSYTDELGKDSNTETFVAIRTFIDNWRWARVPFYLRTGKRMNQRCAEIVIQYKEVSHQVYEDNAGPLQPNRLIIRLQPDEAIQMTMMVKNLEQIGTKLEPVTLNLDFADQYEDFVSDAYKRLMLDAAAGDPSLFVHRDEVDLAWAWVDPIIEAWQRPENAPKAYESGSWGPTEANQLLTDDGRQWYNAGS